MGFRCKHTRLALTLSLLLAQATCVAPSLCAQVLAKKGWEGSGITVEPWWSGAVLYQIDPVSFQDSKGDGFGDLQGIVTRLDYLQGLGVDAILLSPLQRPSDVEKGESPIDPRYGTPEDLDRLVQEASHRKIRVFVDLQFDEPRPAQELVNLARFWLSRGIAGLRLVPAQTELRPLPVRMTAAPLSTAQTVDRLRELRKLCATYAGQRVLLWDMPDAPPGGPARPLYVHHRLVHQPALVDGPQMRMEGSLLRLARLTPAQLRGALQSGGNDPQTTLVPLSDAPNHERSLDRMDNMGDTTHALAYARVLAAALLAGRGAPLLYFGQEVGMATTPAPGAAVPALVEPTPMQWGGETGFTAGVPWIDPGRNAATANVALEDADASSLLNWYRKLSAVRHASEALRSGSIDLIAESNPDIVAWVRRVRTSGSSTAPVLVVCNLSDRQIVISAAADLRRLGLQGGSSMMHTLAATNLLAEHGENGGMVTGPVSVNSIVLPAFGVYLGELPPQAGLENSPSPLRRRTSSHRASRRSARTPS